MSNERAANAEPAPSAADEQSRVYYDEFSKRYDEQRGGRVAGGYHDLVDDLELDFLRRHAAGGSILEVGCGTGLLLERMAAFAARAAGVDLSDGMLRHARARGLDVQQASATDLPFGDASFDAACSFKVLAHVPEVRKALAEMARVVRPGGVVVAEFYNPWSVRGVVKRLGPARAVGASTTEAAVYTRYDPPWRIPRLLPAGLEVIDTRGVRLLVPAAALLRVPWVGRALRSAEWRLCDSPLRYGAGFWLVAARKR